MYTYKFNPKIKLERKKYGIQVLRLKIDHKISSTKDPKERCSKNKNKINKFEVEFNNYRRRNKCVHDVGHEINGGVGNGNPTQFDASWR